MASKKIKKGSGFTLVELVIYMGLFSGFLLILSNMFISVLSIGIESETTSSVSQDTRFLMARLSYDMNRADGVIFPTTYASPSGSLVLSINGENYTYFLADEKLMLSNNAGTYALNGSGTKVTAANFLKYGSAEVKDVIKSEVAIESVVLRTGLGEERRTFYITAGKRK